MQFYQEPAEEKPTHSHYNSFADLLSITSGGPLSPASHSTSPSGIVELVPSSSGTSIEIGKRSENKHVTVYIRHIYLCSLCWLGSKLTAISKDFLYASYYTNNSGFDILTPNTVLLPSVKHCGDGCLLNSF